MISTVDQTRTPLLDALAQAAQCPHHRFYTPGHKGGRGAPASLLRTLGFNSLNLDIPEIPDLDNLFAPDSVIKEAQDLAVKAFGAEHTYFLVNGSSSGLIAAILATCGPGDHILLPRTVHQSIVHGLILSGAHPIWLTPDFDPDQDIFHCITPDQVASALARYPDVKAIVGVSPSYEGVCGDISGLAAIAHQHQIPLIVDEAHGPHFGFHPALPPSALSQGADLVVQSTHKVLGALTQASMLHCQGDRIHLGRLQWALRMVQSSSPNFLLLASLDAARHQMATHGEQVLKEAIAIAQWTQTQLKRLQNLCVLVASSGSSPASGCQSLDPLRLTIILPPGGPTGFALDEWLSDKRSNVDPQANRIIAELPTARRLTFVLGLGNTMSDLEALVGMLGIFDRNMNQNSSPILQSDHPRLAQPQSPQPQGTYLPIVRSKCSPQRVFHQRAVSVDAMQSIGRISQQVVSPYPPGIPILFPGEVITQAALTTLLDAHQSGGEILGAVDSKMEQLWVVDVQNEDRPL